MRIGDIVWKASGMTNPLVSIIIPIYNVEAYLDDCLDAVRKQSYSNMEIICVNDGSPDGSRDIVLNYQTLDKRIILIDKENGGLSDARNAGIAAATGHYLFFLDSDDLILGSCISTLVDLAQENGADIVACDYFSFSTSPSGIPDSRENQCVKASGLELYEMSYTNRYFKVLLNTAWGKLYRKQLFNDERYRNGVLHEDEFLTYRLFAKSNSVYFVPQCLYAYRQRPASIMSAGYSENNLIVLDALEERIQYFSELKASRLLGYAIDDYMMTASSLYLAVESNSAKEYVKKCYRATLKKYGRHLEPLRLAKRLIFFLSPALFEKILPLYFRRAPQPDHGPHV